ncbi:family 20 glycosylhydrolase [Pedobacter punctiformis]|uniref:beta-N-acetylhexosaminidase n=1 Tax=Pedobacter punctiformis TaxID=3004097 RepID=A0ABT4LCS5_9SPHI|nr:family 20 glycosylhydrolase [Pedobacter sp. HCMS5-2]MCZ4245693.1 family 20 glycosylhydrolase [Pedobacter sp. HCMS5-2]
MKFKLIFLLLCMGNSFSIYAQSNINRYSIIPAPVKLKPIKGAFIWTKNTTIKLSGDASFDIVKKELSAIGLKLSVSSQKSSILIVQDKNIQASEGYKLSVNPNQITIAAANIEGAYWAVSTLKQLAGTSIYGKVANIPCVEIEDQPKFGWRGMHLDVARHFFDLAELRLMIDRMTLYKFNKLHLHLTDDQGWRLEIKKYPELTAKGAWRTLNNQDSACLKMAETNPDFNLPEKNFKVINGKKMYGGFYTQSEMKGLIKYAQDRGVEIIPEIDMPGHMMAATKLFPWLSSSGAGGLGKDFSEPICPCKESTFEFAENVFTEVAALFPSKYIHLGADEVEKDSWKKLPECDELMKKEGLKSVEELQSYFIHRMEKFFINKGKKLIGWDEMLEGGMSATATMMYWRAWVPGAPKKATENGNEVIMLPGEFCYFDAPQDAGSLKKVYSFDPYNYNLTEAQKKLILGVQAATWTETIPSLRRLEYMIFPRLLALAEVAWTGSAAGWDDFLKRSNNQYSMLDAMNVNYRMPDIYGFSPKSVFVDQTYLKLDNPLKSTVLHYTTDGSTPVKSSKIYSGPLLINKPQQIKLAAFRPNGNPGEVYVINYERQAYQKAITSNGFQKGLKFSYYPKYYKSVTKIKETDRTDSAITAKIDIPVKEKAPSFGTKHTGYFYAPQDGIYTFYLKADDGSNLYMDQKLLIDNDGLHSAIEKSAQIALGKGYHPFELLFIEGGGGYTLQLEYSVGDGKRKPLSESDFYH